MQRTDQQPQQPSPRAQAVPPAYGPLYNPATDATTYVAPVDTALTAARNYLDEAAATNIHDHTATLKTATGLEYRLRQLVAALDAQRDPVTTQQPAHDPRAYPTAPLPPAAASALTRLELRLNYPTDLYRATTRYQAASERTIQLSAWMNRRDLTTTEFDSFEWAQDVMRESQAELTTAGRLDLIGAQQ